MTENRTKSPSEKKLEKALDIGDDIDNISNTPPGSKAPAPNNEEEIAKRIAERKEQSLEIRERLEALKTGSDDNEAFAEEMFKELAVTDMEILKMVRSELDINPSPRYLETISAMSNAIVTSVQALRDIGKTKHDQEIDHKKLTIKQNSNAGVLGNSSGGATSFADVINAAKNLVKELKDSPPEIKTVDAISIKTEGSNADQV